MISVRPKQVFFVSAETPKQQEKPNRNKPKHWPKQQIFVSAETNEETETFLESLNTEFTNLLHYVHRYKEITKKAKNS